MTRSFSSQFTVRTFTFKLSLLHHQRDTPALSGSTVSVLCRLTKDKTGMCLLPVACSAYINFQGRLSLYSDIFVLNFSLPLHAPSFSVLNIDNLNPLLKKYTFIKKKNTRKKKHAPNKQTNKQTRKK
ncbi:hypothetical protein PoB_003691800 [Plakobranchus ocellatus]|uniref:Uncharacterized protein n=1 Tax=Plakobranchus ocellatus TaxID=259542 RepID=A0AAV4AUB2_9GAST|nr:hypothetical protein PoB_003691800 [Plakobranchus ocellatus]